jgi:hypothetical protein
MDPDSETGSWNVAAIVAKNDWLPASVRDWLVQAPAFPAYAGMLALLVALIFVWVGLEHKLNVLQLHESSLQSELARERAAHARSEQTQQIASAAIYRLTPDDLITRAPSVVQEHAIRIPSMPTVISLELPAPREHDQFRAVLASADDPTRTLIEDGLVPNVTDVGPLITFSLPSTLLSPSKYYQITIQGSTPRVVRTFTFYTAPAQQ